MPDKYIALIVIIIAIGLVYFVPWSTINDNFKKK
jgi:hypothetical protein